MENLFNEEFMGFLLLAIIIIFAIMCVCALYSIAKLHSDLNRIASDLNRIAEEIKFLRNMIGLNNRTTNTGQDRGTYNE
jgi:hypothetical protein